MTRVNCFFNKECMKKCYKTSIDCLKGKQTQRKEFSLKKRKRLMVKSFNRDKGKSSILVKYIRIFTLNFDLFIILKTSCL